ncbi:hypothetical protein [Actinacidiphila yeochonensis]|uniref:hypothetical protein n=1 Tax=Actinacidiphila yeochonensis TaxID=89050 RepID=UPI00055B90CA|nr:hypothetical protein [Actinacidiphila yeochonensis]
MTTHRPLTAPPPPAPPADQRQTDHKAVPSPQPAPGTAVRTPEVTAVRTSDGTLGAAPGQGSDQAPGQAPGGTPAGFAERTPEEIGEAFAAWAAATARPQWTRLPVGPFAIPAVEGTASRAIAGAKAARRLMGDV